MKTKVIKIGGSCLSSAEDMKKIIPILNTGEEFILVVSAFKNVTNLIELWFDTQDRKYLEELRDVFKIIFEELFPDKDFETDFNLFDEVIDVHKNNISRNHAQSLGEKMSSQIVEMYLKDSDVDIEMSQNDPLIFGDNNGFDLEKSSSNILNFYKNKNHKHILTQGFASIDGDGLLNNLCREGSDLTTVIWAYTLVAECLLYKDVGAIYTSDPNENSDAKKISEISFEEYKDKFYKSRVIQGRVVDFCIENRIPLSIYSFDNNVCGTKITI